MDYKFRFGFTVSTLALLSGAPTAAFAQSMTETANEPIISGFQLAQAGSAGQPQGPASGGTQTSTDQQGLSDPNDIIVTGTRGLPRTIADSPTPIDVIGGAEMEKTGRPGVLAALNTLVPSFNVPTRAGGGTSTVITTGGLRGLNPDQTLILINGKRRHKTSLINAVSALYNGSVPADLDLIPSSAIARIEVLRDGAAAQYGSDAIAGVVNIILKSNLNGGEASFSAGQNMDRSDGENYLGQVSFGTSFAETGHIGLFLNVKKQNRSNRAIAIDPSIILYPLVNGLPDPREASIDRLVTTNYGAFPVVGFNSGYNADIEIGAVELYSFGTYSQRDSELNYTFRAPNNSLALPEVYPDGFRPKLNVREDDIELAIGVRGEISGWSWDLSSTYGRNRARQEVSNTLNASLGPTSPTEFYVGTLRSSEWVNSLDATRGFAMGDGNLQVSAGLQHRRETYNVYQGDPQSYAAGTYTYVRNGVVIRPAPGASGAPGFQPGDEGGLSRNNLAAYLDLAYDPSADTTIGGAIRYEHYDDASGDTLIGKLNVRQALTPWLAVRGAASTGFRAPGLAQQIYASTTGQFRTVNGVPNQLLNIKTLPVNSASAIALGAEPLTPEKSTNFSAGLVLTPARSLNITVDLYQIKIRDRIAITSTLTGPAVSAILVANGLAPDISAQYYTNAIDTRTRGVDVVATYRHDLGDFASLSWNVGFNYNKTIIQHIKDNPPELDSLGAGFVLFDRRAQSNLTVNIPKTKFYVSNTTTVGDFSLNTRVVRFGGGVSHGNPTGMSNGQPVFDDDSSFGAKWITDVELSWQVSGGLNLAVGANNIFNVYPDYNLPNFNPRLGSGFYGTSRGYGFTGGYYYGRIGVKF